MNVKLIVFIVASTLINHTFSTIVKVDTVALSKQKTIILFSDNHIGSPAEEGQTGCLLDFLQTCKNSNTSFHILIEQASKFFESSPFRIVFKLHENIEQAYPPLNNVAIQNIEVRYHSLIAQSLLLEDEEELKSYEWNKEYIIDNSKKTVGCLNFKDILDELDTIKQALANYYLSHDNKAIVNVYARHIVFSNQYYDSFKQIISQLHAQHTSILEYAKKEMEQKSSGGLALAERIKIIFNPLLDLNILQNILQSEHENLLVFAGRNHTRDVLSMLFDLEVTSMYRAGDHESLQPSTTLEITEGLSAQPKTSIQIYAPTAICCTAAMVTLYYLLFVIIPTHMLSHA